MVINALVALLALVFPSSFTTPDLKMLWLCANVAYFPEIFLVNRRVKGPLVLDQVAHDSLLAVGLHALFFLSLDTLLEVSLNPWWLYLVFYGMMVVAMPTSWVLTRFLLKKYRRTGRSYLRVVIIGTGPTARRLADEMRGDTGYRFKIIGYCDKYPRSGFGDDGLYIGGEKQLEDLASNTHIDQIYFATDHESGLFEAAVRTADRYGSELFYVPVLPKFMSRAFALSNIGAMTVMSTRPNPLSGFVNRMVKRCFDVAVSSLFLCFYPLIYIPVAIAVKASSKGPVYFKQKRTGYHGKEFNCLKFRTMRVNVDADSRQATADDPRKTKVGDFLRRTSLDELPQFINVLKGDMSIVGPRPHMLKHTQIYSDLIEKYMVRHNVKPGITGWAQVNGCRGVTDRLWKMEKRVECDVWYIENWSLLLDVKIMFRTVINAVNGDQNAF